MARYQFDTLINNTISLYASSESTEFYKFIYSSKNKL